jgi:hypothetical protein
MATKKKRLRKKKSGTLDTVKRALQGLFKPKGKKKKKKGKR